MRRKKIILSILVVIPLVISAQVKDSLLNMFLVETNYSFHVPAGDISKRYGVSNTIGIGLTYKTKQNWTIGAEVSYLFGGHLKDGSSILDSLKTSSGNIINRYGEHATISLTQRGMYSGIKLGKVFPVLGPNRNSGIIFNMGAGWFHHKIRIENKANNAPAVLGDYKKGYDRLTGGVALREFIGYSHLSNNEMINFYIGFEFYQARTKSLRTVNFDTMMGDDEIKYDFLFGIRAGWILPVYRKQPEKFYYF